MFHDKSIHRKRKMVGPAKALSQKHNFNLPKTIRHIAGWGRVKGPVEGKQKAC